MIQKLTLIGVIMAGLLAGCGGPYKKGEKFISTQHGDTLLYLVLDRGQGDKMSKKAALLKYHHESKGNSCQVRYASDSVALSETKAILLSHVDLPDIEKDMLTGGFIKTLSSRQVVVYMIVPKAEFDQYFTKSED